MEAEAESPITIPSPSPLLEPPPFPCSPEGIRGYGWIPLFEGVGEEILSQALADCAFLELPAGSVLLEPGQRNEAIYIVLGGNVVVHLSVEGQIGQAITIPIGQCIGEFSAIDGRPASALVRAETEARLLRLDRKIFLSRLITLPAVARNMMRCLTERTRLANQLALDAQRQCLELAQLRRELELARELQISMLPQQRPLFPDRPDLEISTLVEPAEKVGGDFFDAFFVGEHRLFISIGDGSGHGIAAALLMARTIGLMRVLAMTESSPGELLRQLNERLVEGNETASFVSVFCGFLDLRTWRLVYASGGHCPPLICTGEGVRELPQARGILVGAFPHRTFSCLEHTFRPGELLFLYSDGITEAENEQAVPFGVGGCRQVLQARQDQPLPELLEAVRRSLECFTGSEGLEDDGTMLVLRRPGVAP